MRKYFNWFN